MTDTHKNPDSSSDNRHAAKEKYSYISCDSSANSRVAAICREIRVLGRRICHDDGRLSDEDWRIQTTSRIDGCSEYIIFITKELMAQENRFVRNEFFFAKKAGKPMYAVMLDEIRPSDVDESLKKWFAEIGAKCTVISMPSNATSREIADLMNESIHFAPTKADISPSPAEEQKEETVKNQKKDSAKSKPEGKTNQLKKINWKTINRKTKIIIGAAAAAVVLLIVLGIWLIPEVTISDDPQNFTYDIIHNTVTITSMTDDELKSVKIPQRIEGKTVNKIGESAFSGSANLRKVRMANSVTEIQDYAFLFCEELNDVQISEAVTKIGEGAFSDCTSLTSIKIPGGVIEIGPSAFQGCTSLRSVNISDSVKIIGESAFMNCTDLKKITIPDNVTALGGSIFEGCTSLTDVKLPEKLTEIFFSSFEGCTELDEIVIPDSVKEIGDYAFLGCSSLKKAVIPASVENIVPSAFSDCPQLTIYGTSGSAAEEYAQANNIKFVSR